MEASDVRELELRTGSLRITLRRSGALPAILADPRDAAALAADDLHSVRCPLTGIWYDAPAPGAEPYARVGDPVAEGSVIGLVETMKVFNEVTSDAAGVVRQILVRRGELVTADAPVLKLEVAPPPTPLSGAL